MSVALEARCFCGGVHFIADVPSTQLPLSVRLCHCSLCRYTSGAPCSFHADLPIGVKPRFLAPSSAANITTYNIPEASWTSGFCSTCGCHICALDKDDTNSSYTVSPSIFGKHHAEHFKVTAHVFSKSSKDDGVSSMLTHVGDRKLDDWNPPDNHPQARIVEVDAEFGEDGQPLLLAKCHCGGVSFKIKRPSQEVMGDEYLSNFVSPIAKHKWKACLDICGDCRLVTGRHFIGWAFIPVQSCEPVVPDDLQIGTARSFVSSPGVLRAFCSTCGATIFYICDERRSGDGRSVVDVATGIIRAPEGSLAEDWLTWRSRISWTEDGKNFDKELTEALQEGMNNWAMSKYGEIQNWPSC